ncbi:unnamed protein product, partial [Symbiodinium sp. CCMP2592]
ESYWILMPLIRKYPAATWSVETRLQSILEEVFKRDGPKHVELNQKMMEVLAFDVKALFAELRKTRRVWKYEAKRQSKEWPASAMSVNPKLFEMIAAMRTQESKENLEDDDDELLFFKEDGSVECRDPKSPPDDFLLFFNEDGSTVRRELFKNETLSCKLNS